MTYTKKDIVLQLTNVNIGYFDEYGKVKPVLHDINLTEYDIVREGVESTGQIIAVVGASGRGKSTLFRALTGLLDPLSTSYQGEIKINESQSEGEPVAKLVTAGDIGFVDQKYTIFRHKKIMDTLRYALRQSKLSKTDRDALIDTYLNQWGLLEHKDKYPCELSGGQKQRVCIIEKLLISKVFMVLDEPFSGLDVKNITTVQESFDKISASNEYNTIIFSTHDLQLAVEMADSIYVIGREKPEDTASTIIKHYDLKELGLAWNEYGPKHDELRKEIKNVIMNS